MWANPHGILILISYIYIMFQNLLSVCLSVCLSVGLFPRHGYSFKDRTVWSSPNDSKCLRLGVSVLKISNLPIPEVAFKKNVKILTFFPQLGVVLWDLPWMYTLLSYMHWTFFLLRVKWWTEVVYSLDLLINTSVLFMCTFIMHKKKLTTFTGVSNTETDNWVSDLKIDLNIRK